MKTSLGEASRWLLRETLRGPWTASLRVQALAVQVGTPITIDDTWSGIVIAAYAVADDTEIEVVGGQGRLAAPTAAKQYLGGATLGAIAADLCASAGELAAGDETAQRGAWRSRGGSLATELTRLSPEWCVAADGKVRLVRGAPPTPLLGGRTNVRGEAATYQVDGTSPLVGAPVDGTTIETVLYRGGGGLNPRVTLWPLRTRGAHDASIIAGTISSLANGRAVIDLDNGESLAEIPLFCAAGFVPEGASQVRVLVLDIADDGSNTIAITGVDGRIDALTLANASEAGTLLRSGDKINVQGLICAAPGAPAVNPPGAVSILLDPLMFQPGPPGLGKSRVSG